MSRGSRTWRRVERALLGAMMTVVARVVERRFLRAIERRTTEVV